MTPEAHAARAIEAALWFKRLTVAQLVLDGAIIAVVIIALADDAGEERYLRPMIALLLLATLVLLARIMVHSRARYHLARGMHEPGA